MSDEPEIKGQQQSDKQPVTHPVLGSIVWKPQLEMWETTVELQAGRAIYLLVEPGDQPDDELFAMTQRFVEWLRQHEPTARAFAAEKMLANYNDVWNDDDAITAQEFADTIRLSSISLYGDESATLFYKDGGLFGWHTIIIRMEHDRTFVDATIAG